MARGVSLDFFALIVIKRRLSAVSIAGRLLLSISVLSAVLRDRIKMAKVIVTFNLMPEGPEVDLAKVSDEVKKKVASFADEDFSEDSDLKIDVVDVAFGLKALNVKAILDESKGSTDALESGFKEIEGIKSVEVTDVRRIIG